MGRWKALVAGLRLRWFVVLSAYVAGCISLAAAQETAAPETAKSQSLRVAVDLAYPPFSYRTERGRLEGFDVDIAYALCAEIDRECDLVEMPFSDVIERLRGGEIDIAVVSMSITSERMLLVDFSIPYYRAPTRFVSAADNSSIESGNPNGIRIGVRRGTVFETYARAVLAGSNEVIGYTLQEEIYLDLVLGRLDAGLGNGLSMQVAFLDTELGKEFALVDAPLRDDRYFGSGEAVAIRKGQLELKAALDRAIVRLRDDGVLAEIWQHYFDMPAEEALVLKR
jgi:ABC-type amino acid transport substrate-binding protein